MNTPPLTKSILKAVPEEFGKDAVTHYYATATQNLHSTFTSNNNLFEGIKLINNLFDSIRNSISQDSDMVFGLMLMRCHSSLLASSQLAGSGQIIESFVVTRAALEASLYALYLDTDISFQEVWLNRNTSPEAKKKCKELFKTTKLKKHLNDISPRLATVFDQLYERTIDFGAHPNQLSVTSTSKIHHQENRLLTITNVIDSDPELIELALRNCAQVAICSLNIFGLMRKERFAILNIDTNIDKISGILNL